MHVCEHERIRISACVPELGCLRIDYDGSAARGAQWQNLEHNTETVAPEGKEECMRHFDPWKRSCVRVLGPRKLHVSVYEYAQTVIS